MLVDDEGGHLRIDILRSVDEAVDGAGVVAALGAQHQGCLAGIGGEDDIAVYALGDVARERGLAGARVTEEAEDLWPACLQPGGNLDQRAVLLRRPHMVQRPSPSAAAMLAKTLRR